MSLSCKLLQSTQRRNVIVRMCRGLSTTAGATETSGASSLSPEGTMEAQALVFQYPKSEALFQKITQKCSKEDVSVLAHAIQLQLGRTFRPGGEFYYSGFGKSKGSAGAADEAPAPVEEKTVFDVKLVGFDTAAKIKIIKEVRSVTGLGLKEAKELVEGAPKVISKALKKEQADELKAKLEEIGAKIELV